MRSFHERHSFECRTSDNPYFRFVAVAAALRLNGKVDNEAKLDGFSH